MADFHKAVQVYKENCEKSEDELRALLEEKCALKYHEPDSEALQGGQKWCNSGGIIAFRDHAILLQILRKLV